jgi:hypothetical protein
MITDVNGSAHDKRGLFTAQEFRAASDSVLTTFVTDPQFSDSTRTETLLGRLLEINDMDTIDTTLYAESEQLEDEILRRHPAMQPAVDRWEAASAREDYRRYPQVLREAFEEVRPGHELWSFRDANGVQRQMDAHGFQANGLNMQGFAVDGIHSGTGTSRDETGFDILGLGENGLDSGLCDARGYLDGVRRTTPERRTQELKWAGTPRFERTPSTPETIRWQPAGSTETDTYITPGNSQGIRLRVLAGGGCEVVDALDVREKFDNYARGEERAQYLLGIR